MKLGDFIGANGRPLSISEAGSGVAVAGRDSLEVLREIQFGCGDPTAAACLLGDGPQAHRVRVMPHAGGLRGQPAFSKAVKLAKVVLMLL